MSSTEGGGATGGRWESSSGAATAAAASPCSRSVGGCSAAGGFLPFRSRLPDRREGAAAAAGELLLLARGDRGSIAIPREACSPAPGVSAAAAAVLLSTLALLQLRVRSIASIPLPVFPLGV